MAKYTADHWFQAMDVIISKRLEGVNFNSTELCTIINADYAKEGKYKVSNGSAKYYAYSTVLDYKVEDQVYVTIPNDDFNQQKLILGKYVTEESTPFVFTTPFDTIINVSGNLIAGNKNVCKLLANDKNDILTFDLYAPYIQLNEEWENAIQLLTKNKTDGLITEAEYQERKTKIDTQYEKKIQDVANKFQELYLDCEEKIIWTKDFENNPLMGYTRLGLQGRFQAWLDSLDCRAGEYGYKLRIKSKNKNVVSAETEAAEAGTSADIYSYYDLFLNNEDMYGNPYKFETYYQQEKIFDISDIEQIVGMTLYFYQKTDSFKDSDNKNIPYMDAFKNKLMPNLFTESPYICLGFDASSFDKEKAILSCVNSSTYTSDVSTTDIDGNKKFIVLNWIHDFNGDKKPVSADDSLIYEIRWYRYEQGAQRADEYSDTEWKRIPGNPTFSYTFEPDITHGEEKIKAVILYKEDADITIPTRIYSNVLTFTNENSVENQADKQFSKGLTIWCEDNSYGNYKVYDTGNQLLNEEYKNQRMFLGAYFNDYENGDTEENSSLITEAQYITWVFPASNTQIIVDNYDYSTMTPYSGFYEDAEVVYSAEEDTISITRKGDADNNYAIDAKQLYGIKTSYSATNESNTVECIVKRNNNRTYSTTKEFTFGIAGTTGTDYTLEIDFERNEWALTTAKDVIFAEGENSDSPLIKIQALLYDNKNKLVDLNNTTDGKAKITWKWHDYVCESLDPLKIKQNTSEIKNFSKTIWIAPAENGQPNEEGRMIIYNPEYLNAGSYIHIEEEDVREIETNNNGNIIIHYYTSEDEQTYDIIDDDITDEEWEEYRNEGTLYKNIIYPTLDIDNIKETFTSPKANEITLVYDWTKIPMDTFLILECTISGITDYDLTAYKAVPIRQYSKDYRYDSIEGPTYVFYDSYGKVNVSSQPYQMRKCKDDIYTEENIEIGEGDWIIFNPYDESFNFIGTLSNKAALIPSSIYISGAKQYGVQYREYVLDKEDENYEDLKTAKETLATAQEALANNTSSNKDTIAALTKAVSNARNALSEEYDALVHRGLVKTYWTQPIITLQNNYPSTTLNKWKGNEMELNYDKGYMLAPAIATGKKNSDNTFSGIMMGDWQGRGADSFISAKTGIYGFDHGAMSYGFREDGTAFIGKAGTGRIEFDGNSGQISSSSYWNIKGQPNQDAYNNGTGMLIDLDDGFIDIKGATKSNTPIITSTGLTQSGEGYTITQHQYTANGARVQIGVTGNPYFGITSKQGHNLMWIADSGYYLQSDNYEYGKGMNIDINTGKITAYTFRLQAGYPKMIEIDSSYTLGTETEYKVGGFNSTFDITGEKIIPEASKITMYAQNSSFPLKIGVDTNYSLTQKDGQNAQKSLVEIKGNGFAVNWAGEVFASAGVLGKWILSEEGLFTSQEYTLSENITGTTTITEDTTSENEGGTGAAESTDVNEENLKSVKLIVKVGMSAETGEIFGTSVRSFGWGITSWSCQSRFKIPTSEIDKDKAGKIVGGKSAAGFFLNFEKNTSEENIAYNNCVTGASLIAGYRRNFYVSSTSGSVYINKNGRGGGKDMYFYVGSSYGSIKSMHVYAKNIYFHTKAANQHGIYARFA